MLNTYKKSGIDRAHLFKDAAVCLLYRRMHLTLLQVAFDLICQTTDIVHHSAVEIDELFDEASAVANHRSIQLKTRNASIDRQRNHHFIKIDPRTRAALLMHCSCFVAASTAGATRATLSYIDT